MKFELFGKIISRTAANRTAKDGSKYTLYQLVIEEPGKYPSRFQVGSKLATMFGPKDGAFAVGKWCTVAGFVSGWERDAKRTDGTPFKAYSTKWTVSSITTASAPPADAGGSLTGGSSDDVQDDVPF